MEINVMGRYLVIFGAVLIGAGVVLMLAGRVPFLGRLPGDILIQKKNFTFFFPLATCILISILFSLILWLWSRH